MDQHSLAQVPERLRRYPILDALLQRRSRRFARGATLAGPLAFASDDPPHSLAEAEEAALVFAAAGVTGRALADLPFGGGEGTTAGFGEVMMHLVRRTVPSGDAVHGVALFVTNDEGTWFVRRPQDFEIAEIDELVAAARQHRLVDVYRRMRVRLADRRIHPEKGLPVTMPFNRWSEGAPGSTTFLPVNDISAIAINALLVAFEEGVGYYLLDERNGYRAAGISKFARSRGGHLEDDPARGKVATMAMTETWGCEFLAVEQGAMLQNLALVTAALGLAGFPYFAAHPFGWMQALGFRVENVPLSRIVGAGALGRAVLRALGRDAPVPVPVGLAHEGTTLIKPYCPPWYPTMEAAVLAFVDRKFAPGTGTLANPAAAPWRDPVPVLAAMRRPSDKAIAATIAYADYAFRRYGRFPPGGGPLRTVLAYQAHRADGRFYDRTYPDPGHPSER